MKPILVGGLIAIVIALTTGIVLAQGMVLPKDAVQSTSIATATYPVLGHITLVVKDVNGNIKNYMQTDNTVTQVGEDCIVKRVMTTTGSTLSQCASSGAFTAIAIGTGTAAAADSQTALQGTESSRSGVSSFSITAAGSGAGAHAVISKQFTGITATIAESGVFDNNSTGGNMLARQTFTGVPLASSDSLTVNWDLKFGP